MDIRTKLVLALVSSALLSMALLGYLTYLLSFDLFLQNSSRQLAAIASSKAREVDHLIDHWLEDGARLAGEVATSSTASTAEAEPAEIDSLTLEQTFKRASAANSAIRWLGVYDDDGKRLLATRPELAPPKLRSAAGDGARFIGAHWQSDDGVGVIVTAEVPGGTVAVGFDSMALRQITGDRTGLGETGESLLLVSTWIDAQGESRDGFLIVNPPEDQAFGTVRGSRAEAPTIVAEALFGADADLSESDYLGTPVIASTRTLGDSAWHMLVKIDASEEYARVDTLLDQMRSLGLSLGALAIFGGIFFGVYLARRIRNLADTVSRVRYGELDLRAEVEGADEIALLATSLNEFLNQLDRSSDIFQLGALRVLVAENHAGSRRLLNELLTNWRMRALLVTDGASALEAIKDSAKEGEPVQLIVLDENMPEMDGVKLIEKLSTQKDWDRCPIIMLADDPSQLDVEKLKQMGVGHVVPKPVIASDLMEAILEEMGVSTKALESVLDEDVFLSKAVPRRILLVEDSPIIQRVTMGFLERWGHSVTLAVNGRLALESCRRESFDLILMDLEMPEMNGLEATIAIRQEEGEGRRTPIIALTAKATKADREECMAAGMNDYVAKPIDPKMLYHIVDSYPAEAHARRSPVSSTEETRMSPSGTEPAEGAASPIDWQLARSLTGGDETLLSELIELFPKESAKQLEAIRAGVESGNAEQLVRGAHSLKSSASFFGATNLVACALEVETLGRSSGIAEAVKHLPALEKETARLVAVLEQTDSPA